MLLLSPITETEAEGDQDMGMIWNRDLPISLFVF